MKITAFIMLLVLLLTSGFSQVLYKQENQTFVLSGTSNLHDWQMVSEEASGTAVIDIKDNIIYNISYLQICIPSESLKGKKPGMNKMAYKAMKTNRYPYILYTLKKVLKITTFRNEIELLTRGKLLLSGVERELDMLVRGKIYDTQIIFEGSAPVKMSDHNIEPLAALFGTVKTADETSVYFKINFNKNKQTNNQKNEKAINIY